MHREEHGVELRRDGLAGVREEHRADHGHLLPGPGELVPDRHGEQAAEGEEDEPGHHELDADDLVVHREDVLPDEPELVVIVVLTGGPGLAHSGACFRAVGCVDVDHGGVRGGVAGAVLRSCRTAGRSSRPPTRRTGHAAARARGRSSCSDPTRTARRR